ncbi:hypothetical protein [Kineococcus gynurae]|uniref:hypothetical protein n=1 Tax=Kineococcus gynurae TaxID=452979 RepID=UPI003D7E2F37
MRWAVAHDPDAVVLGAMPAGVPADVPAGIPGVGAAYGLRLGDVPGAAHLLGAPVGDETAWTVRRVLDPAPDPDLDDAEDGAEDVVGPEQARHPLADGGWAVVDRRSATTTLWTPRPVRDAEVVHPYLASTAVVVAHWQGRLALHAGAVLLSVGSTGAVVAVLGARDAGKSTTTWALRQAGCPLVTDDVLVLDPHGHRVWPGPGCVDLRAGAAGHFEVGEALGVVGRRERWRVAAGDGELPARLHLAAVVEPVWGEPAVEDVPVPERLALLAGALALRVAPADPGALLRLLALPFLRWRRPRDFTALPAAVTDLLGALRARVPGA